MKKRLILVIAALLLSHLGFAQDTQRLHGIRVVFDDSGFNYYGQSSGYINLGSDDKGLVLHLQATSDPDMLKYSFTKVVKLSKADNNRIYGKGFRYSMVEQRRAQAKELTRIHKFINMQQRPHRLTFTHKTASIDLVMAYYVSKLGASGYTVEPGLRMPNIRVYNFNNGTNQGRLTFTRSGKDVKVIIAGSSY